MANIKLLVRLYTNRQNTLTLGILDILGNLGIWITRSKFDNPLQRAFFSSAVIEKSYPLFIFWRTFGHDGRRPKFAVAPVSSFHDNFCTGFKGVRNYAWVIDD